MVSRFKLAVFSFDSYFQYFQEQYYQYCFLYMAHNIKPHHIFHCLDPIPSTTRVVEDLALKK